MIFIIIQEHQHVKFQSKIPLSMECLHGIVIRSPQEITVKNPKDTKKSLYTQDFLTQSEETQINVLTCFGTSSECICSFEFV